MTLANTIAPRPTFSSWVIFSYSLRPRLQDHLSKGHEHCLRNSAFSYPGQHQTPPQINGPGKSRRLSLGFYVFGVRYCSQLNSFHRALIQPWSRRHMLSIRSQLRGKKEYYIIQSNSSSRPGWGRMEVGKGLLTHHMPTWKS